MLDRSPASRMPAFPIEERAAGPIDTLPACSVLFVDDEPALRAMGAKYLRRQGSKVGEADGAIDALAKLREHQYDVMVCDVRMPGSSGLDLIGRALEVDPELAIIMLTGVDDAHTAAAALQAGAIDYLVKPLPLGRLATAVANAQQRRTQRERFLRSERALRAEVMLRAQEVEAERNRVRVLTVSVVESLINAMEAKDVYLRGHSHRVADLAASIGEHLGLDEETVEAVRVAGRLHDIGKIGIRESVLNKPGTLTDEEYEHVKSHVAIGMEILAPLRHLGSVLDFVRDHHEHYDGAGYPRGLNGSDISIGGRILAAVDAFDSLTTLRAYREARTDEEALTIIGRVNGQLIDPAVYEALCDVVRNRAALVFVEPREELR
ncbi:MAG: response regulator [Gemmatimonadaceae bacterium]|nr:response regulator [Gemmatimonadaceae bacterium]